MRRRQSASKRLSAVDTELRKRTVEERAAANGWIGKVEAAGLCNLTVKSLRWYVSRRKIRAKPIPVKLIGKRVFFDAEELKAWKALHRNGKYVRGKDLPEARPSWPPSREDWITSPAYNPPRPTAYDFPLGTRPPIAINALTGNLLKPQWRPCMACRKEFLSAGSHERLGCFTPACAWPEGVNKCSSKASATEVAA